MLSLFKFRSFASGAVALGAALAALTLRAAPAHAEWIVTFHCSGTTRYDNTNNVAWEVLKAGGPPGPVDKVTQSWVKAPNRNYNTFNSGASILESPTSASLWNGTLGDLAGPTTDPTIMHSVIDSTGTITAELNWHYTPGITNDIPPARVAIHERASASANILAEGVSRPFALLSQDVSVSLPNATLTTGDLGVGYPWKKVQASCDYIINNYSHATKICLPTRYLHALSSGKDNDGYWHFHDAGVTYYLEAGGGNSGDARLTIVKEIKGEIRGTTEFAEIYPDRNKLPIRLDTRVWVGVQFKVPPASQLMPRVKSVQLRIKEEPDAQFADNQHSDAENHIDPVLPLTPSPGTYPGMKWQKGFLDNYGIETGWADTTEPFSTPNLPNINLGQTVVYRVLWPWDSDQTTLLGTKLWSRNGLHTVSLLNVGGSGDSGILFKGTNYDDPDNPGHTLFNVSGNVVKSVPNRQLDIENTAPSN